MSDVTFSVAYFIVMSVIMLRFVRLSVLEPFSRRHDTQHNDTQHNDTQDNEIQHNNKLNATLNIMTLSIMAVLVC
jgi:hypothetical protein